MKGLSQSYHKRPTAGFTLVELMVTVAIVSVLAAIGLPSLSWFIMRSRTTEAIGFLSEIKARQESYRFDFGSYMDVSTTQATYFPSVKSNSKLQNWTDTALATPAGVGWNQLGAVPSGRSSRFVYSTVAGAPGTAPNAKGFSDTRGYNTLDYWFISTACGDLNDNATADCGAATTTNTDRRMYIESYSHSKSMWSIPAEGVD